MKKITLLIACLFAFVSQGHAQFTESFEAAALPATWTVINNGDANTWIAIDLSASTEISGHTGTHTAGIIYTETAAHDDYLITPAITVAAGVNDRISFWLRSRDPDYPETVDILLSNTTATAAAFTVELATDLAPAGGAAFYKYSYDLSDHVGETIYIAFHSTTLNQFALDLDDVVNDPMPFCSEPNPSASDVTETTATISWPAVAGSVNYEYVLDNIATDPVGAGTSTTATSYNATLLDNSTTYYFHVRNNCDAAGMSAWSTISITTLAPFTGCLEATFGQWPGATYVPAVCDGITVGNITTVGYAGEYSMVTVQAGETYKFASSVATDYITISTDDGLTGDAYGLTPLTWVATVSGDVRFYTHLDVDCGEINANRTRSVVCGIPPCVLHAVTFGKTSNCPTTTFNVTANITNMGSATSITVTDDQGSTPQTVTATGTVTFGPYPNGTPVILTTTNDQTGVCTVVSTAQNQVECPPTNDSLANAIALTCGTTVTGSTVYASLDEDNAPDGFGADMDAPNVWYSYTGTGSAETVTLNLCASAAAYDTSVLVYTGTTGNLTLVAANDDDNSCGVGLTLHSRVQFTSDGTTTYKIAIEGYNVGSTGVYSMDVTCAPVTPPAVTNQTCITSLGVNVDGFDVTSDNSFGDSSPVQPTCDLFGEIRDVWFSFTAPATGTVDVMVTPTTMTSANFNVYSGTCAALVAVAASCNADITTSATESLTGLTASATYYVQVWSNGAEQGTFSLRLTDPNLATTSFDSANFRAYPNPVKNILNLSYDKAISNVAVFNLLGQEVMTKVVGTNQSQVDMSHLASGTYMVKVTADNQVKTIKVVKQ